MRKLLKNKIILSFSLILLTFPFLAVATGCPGDDMDTAFGCIPRTGGLPILIARAFAWTSTIIGTLSMLGLIYAGYTYITAAGNPDNIKKAKDIIMTSLTALFIIIFSYALFNIVGLI